LCLRAIDEVEDHPKLDNLFKAKILRDISYGIQKYKPYSTAEDMKFNWHGQEQLLPEVSLRLAEWIYYCPESFRARVADSTGSMADRMAFWAERNWKVEDESDLDAYTFAVAGAVGLILC
jgi:farnesyl-diphosphate farnesyltransferase